MCVCDFGKKQETQNLMFGRLMIFGQRRKNDGDTKRAIEHTQEVAYIPACSKGRARVTLAARSVRLNEYITRYIT
jgi:hypothetical protein